MVYIIVIAELRSRRNLSSCAVSSKLGI